MKKILGLFMTIFGLIGKVILSIVKLPLVLVKGILGIFKKKKPKDGAEDEKSEEEVEEKGGKRKINIIFLLIPIVLVAILLVVVIRLIPTIIGGQGDPDDVKVKLPKTYFSDSIKIKALYAGDDKKKEDSASTFDEFTEPPEDLEFSIQEPPKEDKDSSVIDPITATTYTYSGVPDPASLIKTYVSNTIYEYKFTIIDEEFFITDAPDYGKEEGVVYLGLEDGGTLRFLSAQWMEDTCIITTDSFAGIKISERESMSLDQAVDFLYSFTPAQLGIETDRPLQSYHIYAMDGIVMINGYPCMRLNIYDSENDQQTNTITGQYFMTSDGGHLFHMDEEGKITEIY